MFDSLLGVVGSNSGLLLGGGTAGIVLWVLKKIPNDKICSVIENGAESVGRVLTLNLSRWKATKKVWNSTIEPYFVDLIDNICGSVVRGLIKGLKSDNK